MIAKIKKLIILGVVMIPEIMYGGEGGLVKCGVERDCTVCDMFILVRDVMNFLFQILGVMAVISVIIGGFYMVISSGDQGKYKQGVDYIKNAILGIVLTLSAFILFNFILVGLGFQVSNIGFGGGGTESDALQFEQEGEDFSLFRVKCDSTSYFQEREVRLVGGGGTGGGSTGNSDVTGYENMPCLEANGISDGVSAVMRTINFAESTITSQSYRQSYGGKIYPEGQNVNPRVCVTITSGPNAGKCSTAYGRFQMLGTTWDGWAAAAGIPKVAPSSSSEGNIRNPDYDMSPANQDLAVAKHLTSTGVVSDCETFFSKTANDVKCQWTSMPGCIEENSNTSKLRAVCPKFLEDEINGKCKN